MKQKIPFSSGVSRSKRDFLLHLRGGRLQWRRRGRGQRRRVRGRRVRGQRQQRRQGRGQRRRPRDADGLSGFELGDKALGHLYAVADDGILRGVEDGGIGVFVDGDDGLGTADTC